VVIIPSSVLVMMVVLKPEQNKSHISNAMTCCKFSLGGDYSFVVSPAVGDAGRIYWC